MRHIYSCIDIGSDSVKIVVCELYHERYNLLATATIKSKGIKKGLITDVNEAKNCVKKGFEQVESMLGFKIKKVIAIIPSYFAEFTMIKGEIDIKGEKLSSVIIVKLPFKAPNDPVTEAIIESLTLEGKNAFMEYQIPESVIKFKQGIGRLIRGKLDRGIVTILDNRIINKKYGIYFKEAIPTKNIKIFNTTQILREVSEEK